jgi:hypothetical protein
VRTALDDVHVAELSELGSEWVFGGACCSRARAQVQGTGGLGCQWRSKCAAIVIGPYQTTTSHQNLRLAVKDMRREITLLVGLVALELRYKGRRR